MMDLKTDCRTYMTYMKKEETVGLSVKHGAVIAEVDGTHGLEVQTLPHVSKAYVGRIFVWEGEIPAGSWIQMLLSEPEIANLLSLK
jgi:hypothetical protein